MKPQLAHSFHPWSRTEMQWLPPPPALVEKGGFIVVMFSSRAVMSHIALCCSSDMVKLCYTVVDSTHSKEKTFTVVVLPQIKALSSLKKWTKEENDMSTHNWHNTFFSSHLIMIPQLCCLQSQMENCPQTNLKVHSRTVAAVCTLTNSWHITASNSSTHTHTHTHSICVCSTVEI